MAKNSKASCPEETPTELIKLIDDDQMEILVDLFNAIQRTEIIFKKYLWHGKGI